MAVGLKPVEAGGLSTLFPLLLLAEASDSALRWSLDNLSDTVYRVEDGAQVVGAIAMRWEGEPCELVELAVAEHRQRQGLGRQIIEHLLAEAWRRGKQRMLVGTGNSSIGNIVFYQKCGFRMDHIRRDYFWHHREPEMENGIRLRDMLVFSYDLGRR
jgi:GNAT superfamily N-acetyltransferase